MRYAMMRGRESRCDQVLALWDLGRIEWVRVSPAEQSGGPTNHSHEPQWFQIQTRAQVQEEYDNIPRNGRGTRVESGWGDTARAYRRALRAQGGQWVFAAAGPLLLPHPCRQHLDDHESTTLFATLGHIIAWIADSGSVDRIADAYEIREWSAHAQRINRLISRLSARRALLAEQVRLGRSTCRAAVGSRAAQRAHITMRSSRRGEAERELAEITHSFPSVERWRIENEIDNIDAKQEEATRAVFLQTNTIAKIGDQVASDRNRAKDALQRIGRLNTALGELPQPGTRLEF